MTVGEKLPVEVIGLKATSGVDRVFGFDVKCDSDIVEIGENGIIVAKATGSANITVTYKGLTKTFPVVVE